MQERLDARGSGQSFEPQSAGRSPSRQTGRDPCCSWQAVDSGINEEICGVAAPRFRGELNRLRYPVLKCAAPVDDASLQGRANRPRGLAVSVIQSSESMWPRRRMQAKLPRGPSKRHGLDPAGQTPALLLQC